MELTFDLTGDQKPARAGVDRDELVGVHNAAILFCLFKWASGKLLDDSGQKVLAKPNLSSRTRILSEEHSGAAERTPYDPAPADRHRPMLSTLVDR
jgi:hypothetical protein